MSEVTITVRGSFDSFHPPERGTVHITVAFEAPQKDSAYQSATSTAAAIADRITPLFDRDRGPVTWWSSDQIRTWSSRPWNQEGKQLPLVHHAAVSYQVKFGELTRLNAWVSDVVTEPGVTIDRVEWALTEGRRVELTRLARDRAVHDARDKAQAYASSLGLAELRAVAVADAGMLGDHPLGRDQTAMALAARGSGAPISGDELRLVPDDIVLSATVDARFVAQ
ncbi:MAG: SIMPL domain-containing protein [Actinomycetota bacterium]